jgi:hypothetical protein
VPLSHAAEHGLAKLLDVRPLRPSLLAQEMKRDGLDQREALDAAAEPARGFEHESCPIGVADQVQRSSSLLGDSQHQVEVGV